MLPSFSEHPILTVRIHAGFNADAFLGGLLALTGLNDGTASAYLSMRFPRLRDIGVMFGPRSVNGIAGYTCRVLTPHEHAHRTPADILSFYQDSTMKPEAVELTGRIWQVLSEAEASVHGTTPQHIHFHEVGRLSNILSVGLIADFITTIAPSKIVAGPLPMTDGTVQCAHGAVPYPAPSLFAMLKGLPVRPWAGTGEPVTPTGLAVLKGLGAEFGPWPEMVIEERATVFTPKVFEGVANGSLFCIGRPL